jgi:hypothetical protein
VRGGAPGVKGLSAASPAASFEAPDQALPLIRKPRADLPRPGVSQRGSDIRFRAQRAPGGSEWFYDGAPSKRRNAMEHASPSLGELLEGHVALDVECFDRIYCNVY